MKQLAAWYQKKISSYDKEEWETMVEQLLMRGTYRRRIVDFSSHGRSYLIDVDLVRGSSFPKAKPTLGMRRVVWYALVRLVFLPALWQWWAQQTSLTCAKLLLSLWALQVLNITLYFISPDGLDIDPNSWLVPLGLMLVLSVVHSQIVSTTEMELARVRPRSTFHRKLPRYIRRPRSECEDGSGGCSAESGATSSQSKPPSAKPAKFRRRQSRSDLIDSGIRHRHCFDSSSAFFTAVYSSSTVRTVNSSGNERTADQTHPDEDSLDESKQCRCLHRQNNTKRKKELIKENVIHKEAPKNKPLIKVKVKAKDSDDEDYMAWKKPDTPLVTFTPPPDEVPSSSKYKSNKLTKKHLESFNVKLNQQIHIARAIFADGDDGFESLNGNNSNASDNENKAKTEYSEKRKAKEKIPSDIKLKNSDKTNDSPKDDDDKSVDSEGAVPMSSPSSGKRVGVRFLKRNTWAKKNGHESCDEIFGSIKRKPKKLENYQSSSSDGECSASAPSIALPSHHTMSDWVGHSTNSEESSYCSQSDGGNSDAGFHYAGDSSWDPFAILDPPSDPVRCTMWERGSTLRTELSAVDISWCVVARAEKAMAGDGCLWAPLIMSAAVALFAPFIRLVQISIEQDARTEEEIQAFSTFAYVLSAVANYCQSSVLNFFSGALGDTVWEISANILSCILRFGLSLLVFFLLSVAERAYKQRFLYAKLFSHLTSARRARKSELPHFRLNTVRNIKTWLSTRSYLRRRGPQRSVDVIVSAVFMLTITLLACVSAQLLRDSLTLESMWLLEAMVWCVCLGIYLLRLLTLGSNVNRKYRGCLSAIITEQINLHLAIEQRPECKEQLTVANNVLKLAADLLKELDAPFKITGIWANHYIYTITKVVILSALSGVLSDMLGFKLKLHKIKIK